MVKDIVLIRLKMQERGGRKIDSREFPIVANSYAATIVPGLISAELLDNAAKKENLRPTEEDRKEVIASYNRACRSSGLGLEQLSEIFGPQKKAFLEQFEKSVRVKTFMKRQASAEVSDADVFAYLSRITNDYEVATGIDATARANADKTYARLRKGESWDVVAREDSEDVLINEDNESFYKEWATVDSTGFGYPELADALPGMKAGDYSKPLETEEGMMIVKVNSIEGGRYVLGRIIFRMAEPVAIPTPAVARQLLVKEKSDKLQLELLEKLKVDAKITYPRGTNLTIRIWK